MLYRKGKLKDFDCKCKNPLCFFTIIQTSTIDSLASLKEEFGEVFVTSAYRCQSHNERVGGVALSNHTLGDAIDIVPANKDIDTLYEVAKKHFKYVEKYKKFIHCDNRMNQNI